MRFQKKVAVITGGAGGIGLAAATRFVAEGGSVVIADREAERGERAAKEIGANAVFSECDVTQEKEVAAAVDTAVERWGRLDLMFNNAGIIGALGSISEIPEDDYRFTMAVNLDGIFFGVKHAARVMLPQGSGCIVSTSSPAGVIGGIGPHVYSTTKAAIIGLTQSVAGELRPRGIRVNAIVPGAMVTPMNAAITNGDPDDIQAAHEALTAGALMPRAGTGEDVAAGVLYMASDDGYFVTGATLTVDAGFSHVPGTGEPGWQYQSAPMMREWGVRGR